MTEPEDVSDEQLLRLVELQCSTPENTETDHEDKTAQKSNPSLGVQLDLNKYRDL